MTELTPELRQKIADHALGTCRSEDDILSDMELTEDLGTTSIGEICEEIGVYLCEVCGWWCETTDENNACDDCSEGDEE